MTNKLPPFPLSTHKIIATLSLTMLTVLVLSLTAPPTQAQAPDGEPYIVQTGDQLSTIAATFYGLPNAYPIIVEATNVKALTDPSFAFILDPALLEVDQKLWIPTDPDLTPFQPLNRTPPPLIPNQIGVFYEDTCPFMVLASGSVRDFDCGYVLVPEDRTLTETRTISLTVLTLRSSATVPEPEPLVIGQGGPGGSSVELFPFLLTQPLAEPLRQRDIVIIEQRGTLYNEPFLFCEEVFDLQKSLLAQADDTASQQARLAAYADCRQRLTDAGINLSAYDSLQNAADIMQVMDALGYGRINYYGISYGTLLGQHLMRDYPTRLRSVILDAVVPTEINFNDLIPLHFDRALREVFAWCAADAACQTDYPNLETVYFDLVDRLNDDPVTVPLIDLTGEATEIELRLDGKRLLELTFQSFYVPYLISTFPQGIYAMSETDRYDWAAFVGGLTLQETFADGLFYSIMCAEETTFARPALSQVYPQVRAAQLNRELPAVCEVWDVEPVDAVVNEVVSSEVPTLFLSGQFDPITPPDYAEQVATSLSSTFTETAYLYTFPSMAHGAINDACPIRIMADFLENPAQPPNSDCIGEMSLDLITFPITTETATAETDSVTIRVDDLRFSTTLPADWQARNTAQTLWSADGSVISFERSSDLTRFAEVMTQAAVVEQERVRELTHNGLTWTVVELDSLSYTALATTLHQGQVYLIRLVSDDPFSGDAVLQTVLETFIAF